MSTAALDAITHGFYTRGLQRSAYAHALQAEMHRLQYDLMRLAPATHAVDIPADYGAPSPAALRCAYCATYFVPAGRSCGCGANREDVAHALRIAQRRLADSMMNVYNRR